MIVTLLQEAGFEASMLGLSLSFNQPAEKMAGVSKKLYNKGHGHSKFLETLMVWFDMTAARYWWQQFDTYRIGVTKQSESTMHTILKRPLTQGHFEGGIFPATLERLNALRESGDFNTLKRELPESFLQRRVVCTNYMSLRRMIEQRKSHKLEEWKIFCHRVHEQVKYPEYLADLFLPQNQSQGA